jgi:capsular polysaccharide biosynthesis protein
MRDLHLGGNETILYADLVSETARKIKVARLQPQNLYAITCDSWSAQFAATFCNALTTTLDDQSPGAISSPENPEPARTVDAALQPGVQVYPRWYLQGSVGLAVGCLVGFLCGFFKRLPSKPN